MLLTAEVFRDKAKASILNALTATKPLFERQHVRQNDTFWRFDHDGTSAASAMLLLRLYEPAYTRGHTPALEPRLKEGRRSGLTRKSWRKNTRTEVLAELQDGSGIWIPFECGKQLQGRFTWTSSAGATGEARTARTAIIDFAHTRYWLSSFEPRVNGRRAQSIEGFNPGEAYSSWKNMTAADFKAYVYEGFWEDKRDPPPETIVKHESDDEESKDDRRDGER